jgi:streptomycin 6-kinase
MMISEFEQNIKNRGTEGQKWAQRIPRIIAECEEKWQIKVQPPFNLTWNYVAPAKKADGSDVVIKIGFPQDGDFLSEMRAMEIFEGQGIEKLLAEDRGNYTMLLERVMPGEPLSEMEDDEKATKILTNVMKKLWKPLPEDHQFPSVRQWSRELFDLNKKYPDGHYPNIPANLVQKAQAWCEELIETSDTPVLIHGDLHQDNVLSSDRDGWLAIDPKGIAAESCYEVGAMIRNPYKKMNKNPQMKEIMQKRIEIMSDELGFSKERIHKWCLVQTVLSAVWSIDSPHRQWEHAVNTALALALDEMKV